MEIIVRPSIAEERSVIVLGVVITSISFGIVCIKRDDS